MCFCVLLAGAGFEQIAGASQPYDVVEIEKFTVAEGVEFPAKDLDEMSTYLVLDFNRSKRFSQVFLSSDLAAQTAPARRVRIIGRDSKYAKGNRAARYIVGLGAGRTKLVSDIKVTDVQSGEVLMEQKVDGHVYGGLFGGETDQAKSNLASESIKTMTKKGYARRTRNK